MNQNVNPSRKKIHFEIIPEAGTLSYESTKRYFSRIGMAIFAFAATNYVAQVVLYILVYGLLLPLIGENTVPTIVTDNLIVNIAMFAIALPVFLVIVKPLPELNLIKEKMKLSHGFLGFCMCFFLMSTGNNISLLLMLLVQHLKGTEMINPVETMTADNPWWINFIFLAILAPILEEIFFRKILCRHLLPLGEGWAIVISAIVFGLAHGNFYQFFYAFFLGLFFAFIYIKTGKLIYTIIYHMLINLIGGVITAELNKFLDLEAIVSFLEDPGSLEAIMDVPELLNPFLMNMGVYMTYSFFTEGFAIVGMVAFIIAITKKKFTVDAGILPPVSKGKYSAFFFNAGIALSIALFTFLMITSLL